MLPNKLQIYMLIKFKAYVYQRNSSILTSNLYIIFSSHRLKRNKPICIKDAGLSSMTLRLLRERSKKWMGQLLEWLFRILQLFIIHIISSQTLVPNQRLKNKVK